MTGRFDPLLYRDPAPNRALIRALEPVSRGFLRHVLRLRTELPAADLARLRTAVNPRTAAFLAPLHPEFLTDWIIDKQIASLVSPYMAHWAAYEVVNASPAAQSFWRANNLIANVPGGAGREYSVRWALQGHGVLLHPEGTPTWHGRHVDPLLPGAVDMAIEAARRIRDAGGSRQVFVVPLVWVLCFGRDVWTELSREMAYLERGLSLPSGEGLTAVARFGAIQRAILTTAFARYGEPAPSEASLATSAGFFDAQDALRDRLLARLEQRHGSTDGPLRRRMNALRKAIRSRADAEPDQAREERALLREIDRLSAFTREYYGGATITQEEVAENLKRMRVGMLSRTLADRVHGQIPVAVAPRTAHVRVPDPMTIGADASSEALLTKLRDTTQTALDRLLAELAPHMDPFRRPNPFAVVRPPVPC